MFWMLIKDKLIKWAINIYIPTVFSALISSMLTFSSIHNFMCFFAQKHVFYEWLEMCFLKLK